MIRHDTLIEDSSHTILKLSFSLSDIRGTRIQRELEPVKQAGQFRYFSSGNKPLGRSIV